MRSILILVFMLVAFKGFACDEWGITGIAPENNEYIPVRSIRSNDMTEEKFNESLDRIEEIYSPIFADDFNARLNVIRKWEDGTVNAYAQQSGKTWKISMFGGLARHKFATQDGFALVACHEIGHHIGGAPKRKQFFFTTWASNEGQSDYWGAMKCFRKYAEYDDNVAYMAEVEVPASVTRNCSLNFAEPEDVAICERTSMAGLSLAKLLNDLRKGGPINFETPDSKKVRKTDHSHPAAQCRLDTYYQGSLCYRGHTEVVSMTDPAQGVCSREMGDSLGLRPLCWYKP